jgi:hypothetical protein
VLTPAFAPELTSRESRTWPSVGHQQTGSRGLPRGDEPTNLGGDFDARQISPDQSVGQRGAPIHQAGVFVEDHHGLPIDRAESPRSRLLSSKGDGPRPQTDARRDSQELVEQAIRGHAAIVLESGANCWVMRTHAEEPAGSV